MTRTIANQYLALCAFAVGVALAMLMRKRREVAAPGGSVKLSFSETEWPPLRPAAPFRRLAAPVLALMAICGGAVFIPFLLH